MRHSISPQTTVLADVGKEPITRIHSNMDKVFFPQQKWSTVANLHQVTGWSSQEMVPYLELSWSLLLADLALNNSYSLVSRDEWCPCVEPM